MALRSAYPRFSSHRVPLLVGYFFIPAVDLDLVFSPFQTQLMKAQGISSFACHGTELPRSPFNSTPTEARVGSRLVLFLSLLSFRSCLVILE